MIDYKGVVAFQRDVIKHLVDEVERLKRGIEILSKENKELRKIINENEKCENKKELKVNDIIVFDILFPLHPKEYAIITRVENDRFYCMFNDGSCGERNFEELNVENVNIVGHVNSIDEFLGGEYNVKDN